jgi:hypothetical protein
MFSLSVGFSVAIIDSLLRRLLVSDCGVEGSTGRFADMGQPIWAGPQYVCLSRADLLWLAVCWQERAVRKSTIVRVLKRAQV